MPTTNSRALYSNIHHRLRRIRYFRVHWKSFNTDQTCRSTTIIIVGGDYVNRYRGYWIPGWAFIFVDKTDSFEGGKLRLWNMEGWEEIRFSTDISAKSNIDSQFFSSNIGILVISAHHQLLLLSTICSTHDRIVLRVAKKKSSSTIKVIFQIDREWNHVRHYGDEKNQKNTRCVTVVTCMTFSTTPDIKLYFNTDFYIITIIINLIKVVDLDSRISDPAKSE